MLRCTLLAAAACGAFGLTIQSIVVTKAETGGAITQSGYPASYMYDGATSTAWTLLLDEVIQTIRNLLQLTYSISHSPPGLVLPNPRLICVPCTCRQPTMTTGQRLI